jgi:hypothetical protein
LYDLNTSGEKQKLLNTLSPELFWNCNRAKLRWDKDKKIIITRIIEHGRPADESAMLQMYTHREIVKIAVVAQELDEERIIHFSKLLKIRPKSFAMYGKKQWYELVNGNDT